MIISALLLAASLRMAEPISISFEVGRAEKAVAALSAASGVPMKAVGPAANEVVFLKVDNMPLGDIMTSLSHATGASWEKQSDGSYQLNRTSQRIAQEREKEVNLRFKRLSAWRTNLLKCLQIGYDLPNLTKIVQERFKLDDRRSQDDVSDADSQKAWARIQELIPADPTFRALARCVDGMDLGVLARMDDGDTMTFATDPNPIQHALPASSSRAAESLQAEQLVWGKALKTKPLSNDEEEGDGERFFTDRVIKSLEESGDVDDIFSARAELWDRTLPYKRKPEFVLLSVNRWGDRYTMDLKLLTREGKLVMDSQSEATSPEETESGSSQEQKEDPNPPKPKASEETRALQDRYRGAGDKVKPAIEKLGRFFDDPTDNDPVWIQNQETLVAIAENRKKNVIACLPDEAGATFDAIFGGGVNVEESFDVDQYVEYGDMAKTETDKLIELRPANFLEHWTKQIDRAAIASCVSQYRRQGYIDLLSLVRMERGKQAHFCPEFVELVDPTFRPQCRFFEMPSWPAYTALLGDLKPEQIGRLKKGETIPYRELSPYERHLVAQILYGERVNVEEEGDYPNDLSGISPTFELPNGIDDGGGLSAEFKEATVAVLHNGIDGDLDEFEEINLSEEPPAFWGGSGASPRLPPGGAAQAMVTIHQQRVVKLKLALTPGHFLVGRFAEPLGKAKDKPVLFGKLPEDLRKKLKERSQFLQFSDLGRGGGSNGEPPPR